MRLFIIGESRFGAAFLRAAIAAGHEVVGVSASGRHGESDPLIAAARALGIAQLPSEPILAGQAGPIRALGAELIALANVSVIVPTAVIESCVSGAICFHPSLLPRHRGRHAVKDALSAGDRFTGVTVFRPDHGADTGPILLRVRCAIAETDTAASLYHDKLLAVGVHCMLSAVAAIESGCSVAINQDALGLVEV
jgi:methionyl-tRNA formyltransferase